MCVCGGGVCAFGCVCVGGGGKCVCVGGVFVHLGVCVCGGV